VSSAAPDRDSETFYLIAIGGTAMAPLAGLLTAKGARVLGSDLPLYPPMSDRIAALGIQVRPGFAAANLPDEVDRVVVGNLAAKDNPELLAALERGLPVASMPQTLHDELLVSRHPVVITGTHGKTTTTALTAWLLFAAGKEPGFLVGGEPRNFDAPYALGKGPAFVVEGDEYSTSYADKGAKFLHYAPRTLVITSVELDHLDLYPDLEAIKDAFVKAVALVPEDGLVVANGEDENVVEVVAGARARVVFYRVLEDGEDAPARGLAARVLARGAAGAELEVFEDGACLLVAASPLSGRHNVANALAAIGVCRGFGVEPKSIAAALPRFLGVKRRMEPRGEAGGILVLDDFAHHPTAVATTIEGARRSYPGRRLWGVFEPRSITGGRADFADAYEAAFRLCDGTALARPYHADRLAKNGTGALDVDALARSLSASGVEAFAAKDADAIVAELVPRLKQGDVVLAMSSGAFGGIHGKLLQALGGRSGG
jgi:UDP-N-acetylmuramate: L-alanyl-gamma-D-glutamyl-meso-diaminopimelate ligase